MFLSNISLFNFRNYRELDLPLERSVTVLTGGNAQGKTNLVEAVALAALARSPRTQQARELIRFDQPQARVTCLVQRESGMEELDIRINAGGRPDQARTSKRFQVNGRARSATDMVGQLRVVLFWPDDLQLIKGPSELRRRFLNTLLTQLEREHARALSDYQHILEQRNALLKMIRDSSQPVSGLAYWSDALARVGAAIMVERQRRVLELQPLAAAFHRELTDDREHLALLYRPSGARVGEAPPGAVAEQLRAAMGRSRSEEIRRGQTVVGPQRDDLEVWLEGRESRLYASQGQQRTAILSLKLAELHYQAEATGEQPVLLLDDVMSELDQSRRERLLAALEPGPQAMITAADLHDLPQSFLDQAAIFHVEAGRVHA